MAKPSICLFSGFRHNFFGKDSGGAAHQIAFESREPGIPAGFGAGFGCEQQYGAGGIEQIAGHAFN